MKKAMMSELEGVILSFGLNTFVLGFLQVFHLYNGYSMISKFFNLVLLISFILLVFQLGAIKSMKETGESLDSYFDREGGWLVVFSIALIIIASLGYVFTTQTKFSFNDLRIS